MQLSKRKLHRVRAGTGITTTGVGGEYFDIAPTDFQSSVEFAFYWTSRGQWEGQNYHFEAHQEESKWKTQTAGQ
jgi:hypothetical protein